METYKIEQSRFTMKDATQPKPLQVLRKYPFSDLTPGTCFYVPPSDNPIDHKRVRTAVWAYNKRTGAKLQTRTMDDGRCCVFNPIEQIAVQTEAEEIHPSQFEFASWLSTIKSGEVHRVHQTRIQQPFKQLTAWIDEFVIKSGKKVKWIVEGGELVIEAE